MTENFYPLNEDEIYYLDNLLYENKQKVIKNAAIFAIIAFIVSIIPMGFLPRSRRISLEDKSQNLIQVMGFGWWLLFFALIVIGVTYLIRLDKKITPLTKDLEEKKGLKLNVKVTKKHFERTPEYYCILVSNDQLKNQKIVLDREQFKTFHEGQELNIQVFKNSKVLIS